MIQRIQTIFLLLVDLVLVVLLFVPYASVSAIVETPEPPRFVTLMDNTGLLVGQIAICIFAALTVVMFKNRPLQMKLCVIGMVISLVFTLLLAYNSIFPLVGVHWTVEPGTYISLANFVFFFIARMFIRKDEEMVKSADRIR